MCEHVQPVLDNIETVEEDKHCHHKARLQKKFNKIGKNCSWRLLLKDSFDKLTLRPRRIVHALLSQSTWV